MYLKVNQRGAGSKTTSKTVGFRPTQKNKQIIKDFMQKNPKLTKSEAINTLIEHSSLRTQLEGSPVENPNAKPNELLIDCPLREVPLPLESPIVYWKPPVPQTTCKICSELPTCESWKTLRLQESLEPPPAPALKSVKRTEQATSKRTQKATSKIDKKKTNKIYCLVLGRWVTQKFLDLHQATCKMCELRTPQTWIECRKKW